MPRCARPLLEALHLSPLSHLQTYEVDVEKLRLARYQRRGKDTDPQLKEAAVRRRLKAATAVADKATAKREPLARKMTKHSHQVEQVVKSSVPTAEGIWEMHPAEPTSTYIGDQSQEMSYANVQSQQQQHTQQQDSPARWGPTSPTSRAMPPTMERYLQQGARAMQEAQSSQCYTWHQQEQQSWQSWEACDYKQSMPSWEGGVQTESTKVGETDFDSQCQGVLDRMLGKQFNLTQVEPAEYGIRESAGAQGIDSKYR
eukprot:TRINITY_DN95589_c0_g1_i1.p1 TRINITY_DN95589_c0_g1~~TRINITY_DN95589_c0_g1_i1.p1  ORF type:complete len:257 (-),score=43.76 TRINITY_DN95589_c0_g1_i1:91-861(-)